MITEIGKGQQIRKLGPGGSVEDMESGGRIHSGFAITADDEDKDEWEEEE